MARKDWAWLQHATPFSSALFSTPSRLSRTSRTSSHIPLRVLSSSVLVRVLIALILVSFAAQSQQTTIYLSPLTSLPWHGDCNDLSCGLSEPCLLEIKEYDMADFDGAPCDIQFVDVSLTQVWDGITFNGMSLQNSVKMTIFNGTGLNLINSAFNLGMPLYFNLNGRNFTQSDASVYNKITYDNAGGLPWPSASEGGLPPPLFTFFNGAMDNFFFTISHLQRLDLLYVELQNVTLTKSTSAENPWFYFKAETMVAFTPVGLFVKGGFIDGPGSDSFLQSSSADTWLSFSSSAPGTSHNLRFAYLLDILPSPSAPDGVVTRIDFDFVHATLELNAFIDDENGVDVDNAYIHVKNDSSVHCPPSNLLQKPFSSEKAHNWQFSVEGASEVKGLDLSLAHIVAGNGSFINCAYKSLVGSDTPAFESMETISSVYTQFIVDDSWSLVPVMEFNNSLISLQYGATLVINKYTHFIGNVKIGTVSGGCALRSSNVVFLSSAPSRIATFCDLSIDTAINGNSSIHTISAEPMDTSNENLPMLSLPHSNSYGVALELGYFGVLSIVPDPGHPEVPALRGESPSPLVIRGLPLLGVRIEWSVALAVPDSMTRRWLFTTSDPVAAVPSSSPAISFPGDYVVGGSIFYEGNNTHIDVKFAGPVTDGPVVAPPHASTTPVASCPPGFVCTGGTWTSNGSVTTNTSFIITAPTVVILGNLTVNGSLILSATTSNITVTGCLELGNQSSIVIDLDQDSEKGKNGQTTTVTQSSSCSQSLVNIPLSVKKNSKGCEKASVSRSSKSSKDSLVIILAFDKSDCDTKWIILGSVLGAVVVIGCVVTVVVVTMLKDKKIQDGKARLRG